MADDGAERGDVQEEPGKSYHAKSKQVLKNDMMWPNDKGVSWEELPLGKINHASKGL